MPSAERQICTWPRGSSGFDCEVRYQAVKKSELVAKVDDPTREVAFEPVAYKPTISAFRARIEERARVRELG